MNVTVDHSLLELHVLLFILAYAYPLFMRGSANKAITKIRCMHPGLIEKRLATCYHGCVCMGLHNYLCHQHKTLPMHKLNQEYMSQSPQPKQKVFLIIFKKLLLVTKPFWISVSYVDSRSAEFIKVLQKKYFKLARQTLDCYRLLRDCRYLWGY